MQRSNRQRRLLTSSAAMWLSTSLAIKKNAYAGQRGATLANLPPAASGVTRTSYLSGLERKSRIKHRIAMNASKRLELACRTRVAIGRGVLQRFVEQPKAWYFC